MPKYEIAEVSKKGKKEKLEWWKEAVFYQIYPRSFADSNGDGVGDLAGIISKLDYLSWLGVDAIWLSPIYSSPMKDFGYDISDFRAIDPLFGCMEDFDELLAEAHKRGIKVIMDFTFNHTSSEHPWFLESASSRDNAKKDWYIWRDPKWGRVPNNWRSLYGNSAWTWSPGRRQYYFHLYLPEQPDINWRNPEVKEAIFNECRFWLDKGVDGFRMDSIHMLYKNKLSCDNRFRLGPYSYLQQCHENFVDTPGTHRIWKEFRKVLDEYKDRMMVGEADPVGLDGANRREYYGNGKDEFPLIFAFSFTMQHLWSALSYKKVYEKWLRQLPKEAWPALVFNNHDLKRTIGRFGRGKKGLARAKVATTMLLALRSTPFLYYGEEIGMAEMKVPRKKLADPVGVKFWPFIKGRDGSRTPMQWNATENGGFSKVEPWLPVNDNYKKINVETEMSEESSILHYYKNLIALRKELPELREGDYKNVYCRRGVWIFKRVLDTEVLIVLNFSLFPSRVKLSGNWQVLLSTEAIAGQRLEGKIKLKPYQTLILKRA